MDEPMDDEVHQGAVVEGSDVMDVEGPAADATANGDQKMEENRLSGSFTWPLPNFSKMAPDKLFSDQFEIGTHLWRLLIFPRGNKQPTNHLALYLEAPEASYTPQRMAPKAAFKLTLINHLDEKKSFHKEATHTFSSSETDWGFTQFLPLEDIFAKGSGFLDANDTLTIRVDVTLLKDNPEWDSRKETGCVGLKNQGATCYMNSLLQYLYQVPYFRKAVYHMPTPENEEPSKSLPLALQSLFYKLQYSRIAVSTKDLTKAFGWGTYDAFQQHDVQELNRVLCEKLEEKMKGTKVEKVINDLFEGHTELRIECLHVPYKSQPKCESFMDLQLDVKGCKNIYDSFDRQTEVETLEGNNKYHAENYGLQDAKRGMKFKSFPPVLQLQLKRFEYDFQRDTMVKINDRYEFYDELDLDCDNRRYLTEDSDPSVRNKYRLHSVLSHTGGVHGGHYYAFIRPDGKTWLKFDDEKVTKEDDHKAMEDQFGGEDENPPPAPGYTNVPTFKFTKYSNAYMLVYVRESDWDRVMCDVTKEDIAEHLREYLEQEQRDKELRKKEKEEAHLYCTLRVATEEDMANQVGKQRHFDLVDHDKLPPATGHYRMRKQTRFLDFKREVERRTGVPVDKQRYWSWSRRQNGTLRVSRMLTPEEEQGTLMDLREHREQGAPTTKHALMELKLFLELPKGGLEMSLHERRKQDVLLFFKLYDPVAEQLRFLGAMYVHKNARVAEMKLLVVAVAGEELSPDVELEYYEEIKWEPSVMCEQLDSRKTLSNSGLEDGDIVCCQRALSAEEAAACRFPSVARYLEYIRNRRVVQVRRVDDPKGDGFTLEMLREDSYDKVTAAIAAAIGNGAEPHKLRLTQHNAYSHQPQRQPVKWQGVQRLEQMLTHASHQTDVLYYELLDMPLEKLEQLKTLKVWFHNDKTEAASEHIMRLPKGSSAGDLLAELRRMLGAGYEDKPLRLLEVMHSKIFKVIDPADGIDMINDQYWQLRAEVIPDDQLPGSNLRVVPVYHCTLDTSSSAAAAGKDTAAAGAAGGALQLSATNFGEPFFFAIAEDETLRDLKPRIQAKLGIPDEEFAKWQFAFVTFKPPSEALRDDDVVASRFAKAASHAGGLHSSGENYLALVHEDKGGPRRQTHSSYRFPHEKPVKIYS